MTTKCFRGKKEHKKTDKKADNRNNRDRKYTAVFEEGEQL